MNEKLPEACYVMLHIGTGPSYLEVASAPPIVVHGSRTRFDLDDDIWIEKLEVQCAKNIQKACDAPHHNIVREEQDMHLYAFVRRVPEIEKTRYEGLEDLFAVTALSRLIHPTSIGGRYCARVFHYGLKDSAIQAIQFRGMGSDVFIGRNKRDWLSSEDAKELCRLMPWVAKEKAMPGRVHRAYWYHEYAMRSYYLDVRWTLVVTGLESLISVGKDCLRKQFCDRAGKLAAELQVDLTDNDLQGAYTLRSKLSHGEDFLFGLETTLPKSKHLDLYGRLESLLRSAIRRSLLDERFRNYFRDDAAVEERWAIKP